MIHDAVLHLVNEQPLLVDVFETPSPGDTVLVCTNLRTMSKTRPTFADRMDSTFVFAYAHVRFLELPASTTRTVPAERAPAERVLAIQLAGPDLAGPDLAEPHLDLELDEDFQRRVRDL